MARYKPTDIMLLLFWYNSEKVGLCTSKPKLLFIYERWNIKLPQNNTISINKSESVKQLWKSTFMSKWFHKRNLR